jgi:hypothetical protein
VQEMAMVALGHHGRLSGSSWVNPVKHGIGVFA